MTVESILWFVIVLAIIGLVVGAVARLLVPGPTPIGIGATIGAGIAGTFIGGFVGRLLFGPSLTMVVFRAVGRRRRRCRVAGRADGAGRTATTRGYDDRVIVERPLGRRRRFF